MCDYGIANIDIVGIGIDSIAYPWGFGVFEARGSVQGGALERTVPALRGPLYDTCR